jgi:hypothetical protein
VIALGNSNLSAPVASRLHQLQTIVDGAGDYAARVSRAKSAWDGRPVTPFQEVREKLAHMCSGNRRCAYCEDSFADEIEHMRPKDLYPEEVFEWTNFLLACGPCNGPKNNKFAVIPPGVPLTHVSRKPKAQVVPPPTGRFALIDPRLEDPVKFLYLDFETFRYVPNSSDKHSEDWIRADYTIRILRLNERDDLVRGRRSALDGFSGRLREWIAKRHLLNASKKAEFVANFRAERYRGVWERVKLYHNQLPALSEVSQLYIRAAPEAPTW